MNRRSEIMNTKPKEKMHEALTLIEEAAKDTAVELWQLIKEKYPTLQEQMIENVDHVKDSFDSIKEDAREKAIRLKEASGEKMKIAASQLDHNIHHHPWYYLGGIAVSSLLLGYILGKKSGS